MIFMPGNIKLFASLIFCCCWRQDISPIEKQLCAQTRLRSATSLFQQCSLVYFHHNFHLYKRLVLTLHTSSAKTEFNLRLQNLFSTKIHPKQQPVSLLLCCIPSWSLDAWKASILNATNCYQRTISMNSHLD